MTRLWFLTPWPHWILWNSGQSLEGCKEVFHFVVLVLIPRPLILCENRIITSILRSVSDNEYWIIVNIWTTPDFIFRNPTFALSYYHHWPFTRGREGGYSWEFLVGVCRPVPQILTRFQTKNVIFHTRFQTRPLKSIPVFRPGLKAEIMLSLRSR